MAIGGAYGFASIRAIQPVDIMQCTIYMQSRVAACRPAIARIPSRLTSFRSNFRVSPSEAFIVFFDSLFGIRNSATCYIGVELMLLA